MSSAKNLPVFLIEQDNARRVSSISDIEQEQCFWTLESEFFQAAEAFISEAPVDLSLFDLDLPLKGANMLFPKDPVLCDLASDSVLDRAIFSGREVDTIRIHRGQRRVDLRWVNRSQLPRWFHLHEEINLNLYGYSFNNKRASILFGQDTINISGQEDEIGVSISNTIYLFSSKQITKYCLSLLNNVKRNFTYETAQATFFLLDILDYLLHQDERHIVLNPEEYLFDRLRSAENSLQLQAYLKNIVDLEDLSELVKVTNWKIYDPYAWISEESD